MESLKVVVTGDFYSCLKLIQSVIGKDEGDRVNLAEKTAKLKVENKEIQLVYVPHWWGNKIGRRCDKSDALFLIVYDEHYEDIPYFEKVYNVFKEKNEKQKLFLIHEAPKDEAMGRSIAKKLGAEYIKLPQEKDYNLMLSKIKTIC